jgi:hypothetical protein
MLTAARDIIATINLENRLSLLREEYMQRVLGGQTPEADFWSRRESVIITEVQRVFFNQKVRDLIRPSGAPALTDAEDFDQRQQARMDDVIFATHRILAAIPFVGQPEYMEG